MRCHPRRTPPQTICLPKYYSGQLPGILLDNLPSLIPKLLSAGVFAKRSPRLLPPNRRINHPRLARILPTLPARRNLPPSPSITACTHLLIPMRSYCFVPLFDCEFSVPPKHSGNYGTLKTKRSVTESRIPCQGLHAL